MNGIACLHCGAQPRHLTRAALLVEVNAITDRLDCPRPLLLAYASFAGTSLSIYRPAAEVVGFCDGCLCLATGHGRASTHEHVIPALIRRVEAGAAA